MAAAYVPSAVASDDALAEVPVPRAHIPSVHRNVEAKVRSLAAIGTVATREGTELVVLPSDVLPVLDNLAEHDLAGAGEVLVLLSAGDRHEQIPSVLPEHAMLSEKLRTLSLSSLLLAFDSVVFS